MKRVLIIFLSLILAIGLMIPIATPASANTKTMPYLGMNVNTEISGNFNVFQFFNVRLGVYLALNRTSIASAFGGVKVISIVNPTVQNTLVDRPYNTITAKARLTDAGYPNGFITTLATTSAWVDLASVIKANLAAVGINVTIEVLDQAVFMSKLTNDLLPFFLTSIPVDTTIMPPETLGRLFMSTSPGNNTGYNNSTFDSLYTSNNFSGAENCVFGPGGLPVVPLYYSTTPYYIVRVQSVCPIASSPLLTGVQIDWSKTGGAPPNSGLARLTPFNIFGAGGEVTITAPFTHVQGFKFFVFREWLVGIPPASSEITTNNRTLIFSPSADKLATARYEQITSLGSIYPEQPDFNPVGASHSVWVNIPIAISGIKVLFKVEGANPQISDFIETDETGKATFEYIGTSSGMDVIWAFIDSNNNGNWNFSDSNGNGKFDAGEPCEPRSYSTLKYWVENFFTGGGNVRNSGGKIEWNFSGTVGLVDNQIVGEFHLKNFKTGISYHSENFTFLNFLGNDANSPEASNNIVAFQAIFGNNKDESTVELNIIIQDNGEPGSKDGICIRRPYPLSEDVWVGQYTSEYPYFIYRTIDNGNFQIHNVSSP